MGRICGFKGVSCSQEETVDFLQRCYPIRRPESFNEHCYTGDHCGLGAEGEGSYFVSPDKNYVCIADGITFPTETIKNSVQKLPWKCDLTNSANVILNFYIQASIQKFDQLPGGYVFVILDKKKGSLIIGRDRFGVKRIYYSKFKGGFIFSSNLFGLVSTPGLDRKINNEGMIEYFSFGFIAPPRTIYENIKTLNPGEYGILQNGNLAVRQFYSPIPKSWEFHDTSKVSEDELIEKLDHYLVESVKRRVDVISDRKIAAYLSSGLDSSLGCALLRQRTGKSISAYTLGSTDPMCNEVPAAEEIAAHLGIDDHTAYYRAYY